MIEIADEALRCVPKSLLTYTSARQINRCMVDANRVGKETEKQYTATTRDDKTILDLKYLHITSLKTAMTRAACSRLTL